MPRKNKLYQCPYEKACKCSMDLPCLGCETWARYNNNTSTPNRKKCEMPNNCIDCPVRAKCDSFQGSDHCYIRLFQYFAHLEFDSKTHE